MDDAGVLHKGQGWGSVSRVGFYGPSAVGIRWGKFGVRVGQIRGKGGAILKKRKV